MLILSAYNEVPQIDEDEKKKEQFIEDLTVMVLVIVPVLTVLALRFL